MAQTVLFFARLRDEMGRGEHRLSPDAATPQAIIDALAADDDRARLLDEPFVRIIVNDELANRDTPLEPGDTIAFCPPFSGG